MRLTMMLLSMAFALCGAKENDESALEVRLTQNTRGVRHSSRRTGTSEDVAAFSSANRAALRQDAIHKSKEDKTAERLEVAIMAEPACFLQQQSGKYAPNDECADLTASCPTTGACCCHGEECVQNNTEKCKAEAALPKTKTEALWRVNPWVLVTLSCLFTGLFIIALCLLYHCIQTKQGKDSGIDFSYASLGLAASKSLESDCTSSSGRGGPQPSSGLAPKKSAYTPQMDDDELRRLAKLEALRKLSDQALEEDNEEEYNEVYVRGDDYDETPRAAFVVPSQTVSNGIPDYAYSGIEYS